MNDFGPLPAVRFELRLSGDDRVMASFREVSGLEADLTEVPFREGGENAYVHRLPAADRYRDLVCKRGLIGSVTSDLGQWLKNTLVSGFSGKIQTKDLELSLVGPEATPVMAWVITGAWPVKWKVAPFDAVGDGDALAVQTLEFAYQTVVRVADGQ
ncbi:phage tail protein [Maliponia aquimaris]|uniref:T4-like virus tail tube protein gp19 n=1 Tax=Maliponia aquimaris TaxID=1673631 RepID=A0A238JN37_9RHOB|nr:phage tail protein [Maliponia aquimaris]SMX32079.1 T4-like virus tail tube protein gp19 [Maliponia aquimaris]